jgi:hypothetical protein
MISNADANPEHRPDAGKRRYDWPGMVGAALALAWVVTALCLFRYRNPHPLNPRGPWMVLVALLGLASLAIVFGLVGILRKPRRYGLIAITAGIIELWICYAMAVAMK